MTHQQLIELLTEAGFNNGWVLHETTLTVWEHDENPPAPLTRPE
jgi:hypothetical protein